jgi:spore germination cell wall hydrolase CwlJ-like protein
VNIRKEAGTDSAIVGKLYKGAGAEIIERGEEWTKISSGSVTGYVSNDYVVFEDEAKELAEKYGKVCAVVTTDALRIRREASEEAAIIDIAEEDQQLEVDEDADEMEGWVAVKYGKSTYYVSDQYVDKKLVVDEAISIEEEQAALEAAAITKQAAAGKKKGASVSASTDETTLLAAIIYCEAGGESYEGKVAVGAVVMNRVKSASYPNTIEGVIYQSGQFSPVASGKLSRVLSSHSYTSSCVDAAKEALSGVSNVGNAKSFRTVRSGHSGMKIGGHVFF